MFLFCCFSHFLPIHISLARNALRTHRTTYFIVVQRLRVEKPSGRNHYSTPKHRSANANAWNENTSERPEKHGKSRTPCVLTHSEHIHQFYCVLQWILLFFVYIYRNVFELHFKCSLFHFLKTNLLSNHFCLWSFTFYSKQHGASEATNVIRINNIGGNNNDDIQGTATQHIVRATNERKLYISSSSSSSHCNINKLWKSNTHRFEAIRWIVHFYTYSKSWETREFNESIEIPESEVLKFSEKEKERKKVTEERLLNY